MDKTTSQSKDLVGTNQLLPFCLALGALCLFAYTLRQIATVDQS